jgi:hypothetical protein
MRIQKQLNSHRPEIGQHGDCHRTAIAVILGLEAKNVPHFCDTDDTEESLQRERAWLEARGLTHIHWVFPGTFTLAEMLEQSRPLKNVPAVLLGRSSRGVNHSVVVLNGQIVCDPATGGPNPAALAGPAIGGASPEWWLTIYTVANTFNPNVPFARPLNISPDYLYSDGERGIP